jgi:peptidoglycan hydrolase-like protein with peptidoglycan-binding domain
MTGGSEGRDACKLPGEAPGKSDAKSPIICKVLSPYGSKKLQYGDSDWEKRWGGEKSGDAGPDKEKAKDKPQKKKPAAKFPDGEAYVYELQLDLMRLGYLSNGRGFFVSEVGRFQAITAGAVITFKWDLMELYGVKCCDSETWEKNGPGTGELTIKDGAIFFDPAYCPSGENKDKFKQEKFKKYSCEELKKLAVLDKNTASYVKKMLEGKFKDKKVFFVPIDDEAVPPQGSFKDVMKKAKDDFKGRFPDSKVRSIASEPVSAMYFYESRANHTIPYYVPGSIAERLQKGPGSLPAHLKAGKHRIVIFGLDWFNEGKKKGSKKGGIIIGPRYNFKCPGTLLFLTPPNNERSNGFASGRGWGISQVTTTTEVKEKVRHVRGLPILKDGEDVPEYIRSYEGSLLDGMYNIYYKEKFFIKPGLKRDCTFDGEKYHPVPGEDFVPSYQCTSCLQNFNFPDPFKLARPKNTDWLTVWLREGANKFSWKGYDNSDFLMYDFFKEKKKKPDDKKKDKPILVVSYVLSEKKMKEAYGVDEPDPEKRREYPCSWLTCIIRYAGGGDLAWWGFLKRISWLKNGGLYESIGTSSTSPSKVKSLRFIDDSGKPITGLLYQWSAQMGSQIKFKCNASDTPGGEKATKTGADGEIAEAPFYPTGKSIDLPMTLTLSKNKGVAKGYSGTRPLDPGEFSRKKKGYLSADRVKGRGKLVFAVKKILAELGYDGFSPYETFDEAMAEAIKKFQAGHVDWSGKSLAGDGKVTPETADALNSALVGIAYARYRTPATLAQKTYRITVVPESMESEGLDLSSALGCDKVLISIAGYKSG